MYIYVYIDMYIYMCVYICVYIYIYHAPFGNNSIGRVSKITMEFFFLLRNLRRKKVGVKCRMSDRIPDTNLQENSPKNSRFQRTKCHFLGGLDFWSGNFPPHLPSPTPPKNERVNIFSLRDFDAFHKNEPRSSFFCMSVPRSLLAEKISAYQKSSHHEGLQNTRGVHSAAAGKI